MPRHAKFHLDPSNRLATVHQRYRQDRQDRQIGQTEDGLIASGEPFYKRSPKNYMLSAMRPWLGPFLTSYTSGFLDDVTFSHTGPNRE